MIIANDIRYEKLQYDINREAAKISASSSGKIDKYEYLIGEEILPPCQKRVIEQARFSCFTLGKAFGEQIKIIEDQGEKQIKVQVKKLIFKLNLLFIIFKSEKAEESQKN